MKILNKLLFGYCFIFALFLFLSGLLSSKSPPQLLMQAITLPLVGYFVVELISAITHRGTKKDHDTHSRKARIISFVIICIILGTLATYSILRIISQPQKQPMIDKNANKIILEKSIEKK
ncbi:MAG: hypothetical protein HZC02_01730 [Candidatus Levybacteria bacterium]|nr:hypothetical protein [Candidatus Levybacteria bacterium]